MIFRVQGEPVPQPRPRVSTRGGFARAYVPKEHAIHAYREAIAFAAKTYVGKPSESPMKAECRFVFVRPKSHKTKSGLAKGAPLYPKCDCDNLAKGVLDALNGVAFVDDSQVVELHVTKAYGEISYTEVILGNVP